MEDRNPYTRHSSSSLQESSPPPSPYPYASTSQSDDDDAPSPAPTPPTTFAFSSTDAPRLRAKRSSAAPVTRRVSQTSGGNPPGTGRAASAEDAKADQIVQHFYAKTLALLTQARTTHADPDTASPSTSAGPSGSGATGLGIGTGSSSARAVSGNGTAKKPNKWFNLETPDVPERFRPQLKPWKTVSQWSTSGTSSSSMPITPRMRSLVLRVELDTSTLSSNQVLTLTDPETLRRSRVLHGPGTTVLLERWNLGFQPFKMDGSDSSLDASGASMTSSFAKPPAVIPELPAVYKSAIIHFRTFYTLLRALPAWSLYKRLSRRRGVGRDGLSVVVRVEEEGEEPEDGSFQEGEAEMMRLGGVVTPLGTLYLSAMYRLNADFAVEAIETLLSSSFIDQDFFRPSRLQHLVAARTLGSSGLSSKDDGDRRGGLSRGRPGSLPTTSGFAKPSSPLATTPEHTSAAVAPASSIATPALPVAPTSYGSLSSRHPFPERPRSTNSGESVGVEPAFLSAARARTGSQYGSLGTGGGAAILRAVPLSSSPSSSSPSGIVRRPSITSSSASSGSSMPIHRSSSHLTSPPLPSGPTSNIHRVSSSPSYRSPSGGLGGTPPLLQSRSPLAGGASAPRPIPTGYSSSSSATAGLARAGSYSRSYGRASSTGSETSITEGPVKRFLSPGPQADEEDINSFLSLLDSKPELQASRVAGHAAELATKEAVEDQLKKLAGSVFSLPGEPARMSVLRPRSSRLSIGAEGGDDRERFTGSRRVPSSSLASPHQGASSPSSSSGRYFPARTPSEQLASPSSSPSARFPPYISTGSSLSRHASTSIVRAAAPQTTTAGFDIPPPPPLSPSSPGPHLSTTNDSSLSSLHSQSNSGGVASYGGEEEAVGRLELGDEDGAAEERLEVDAERGRGWRERKRREQEERDRTPGVGRSSRRRGVFGEGERDSPPEVPWMG